MFAMILAAPTVAIERTAALCSRYWGEHGQDDAYSRPFWC